MGRIYGSNFTLERLNRKIKCSTFSVKSSWKKMIEKCIRSHMRPLFVTSMLRSPGDFEADKMSMLAENS